MSSLIASIITTSIPLPISSGVSIFFKLHVIWRWKTDALDILTHKQSYFAGCCLEYVNSYNPFGNQSVVPIAKIALLGSRLLKLQTQYEKTSETYKKLYKTILLQQSFDIHVTLTGGPVTDQVFGVTTNRLLRIQAKRIGHTVIEIFRCLAQLSFEIFELSQHCVLVLESLRWNDQSLKSESLRKFFMNTQVISDQLTDLATNQNKLLDQLQRLQPFFKKHFNVELNDVIEGFKLSANRAQELATMHDDLREIVWTAADIGKKVGTAAVEPVCNIAANLMGLPPLIHNDFCPHPSFEKRELNPSSMKIKSKASVLSQHTL